MAPTLILSFLLCLVLGWAAIHLLLSKTKKGSECNARTLPPGPPTIPIFGNLFNLGSKPHISFAQLAKTYGPLITLHLGQVTTVIISSAAVAKEALQKNDLSFSNRNVALLLMLFVLSTTIKIQLSGCQYHLNGEVYVKSATPLSSLPVASKPPEPSGEIS